MLKSLNYELTIRCRLPERGSGGSIFASAIRERISASKFQMIVCLVPNTSKETYDAIKRICCVENSIPSQVVTSGVLNGQKAKSVITKIAIQMNCKLGGEIWGVTIPVRN